MMKRAIYYIWTLLLCFLISCDVHEWPEYSKPVKKTIRLKLDFDTSMSEKEVFYNARSVNEIGDYEMRYVLRAFAVESDENGRSVMVHGNMYLPGKCHFMTTILLLMYPLNYRQGTIA